MFDGTRMRWVPVADYANKDHAISRMKEIFYSAEGEGRSYQVVSDEPNGRMVWAANLRAHRPNENEKLIK